MTSIERCGLILVGDTAEAAASQSPARAEVDVELLVVTYSSLLFRVAHAVLRNPAEAEDAVQDAFLRVLAHREKLPGIQDVRVWLVRIVWRLALDRRSRITPSQIDDQFVRSLVAQHLPADEALAASRHLERVLQEIEQLPSAERHVLLLSALEEVETPEIASVLGKSESAVRALLFRARTRLRNRLERPEKRRALR